MHELARKVWENLVHALGRVGGMMEFLKKVLKQRVDEITQGGLGQSVEGDVELT